jgi:hypothetical protein
MSTVSLIIESQHRSHGVTLWHSQMRHPIQDRASHQPLRRLSVKAARGHSLTKDHLQPEHCGLRQSAPLRLALALPLRAAMTADAPHVLIAGVARLRALALPPEACAFLRRDDGPRASLRKRLITLAVVVTAITRDPRKSILDLCPQVREYLPIAKVIGCYRCRHNLSARFINSDIPLAPGTPTPPALLTDLPCTFAGDCHARRIHHQRQRRTLGTLRQGDFQCPASPIQRPVAGYTKSDVQQLDDRGRQAFSRTQRQVIKFLPTRQTKNRRLGLSLPMSALATLGWGVPRRQDMRTDPSGQASTINETSVIFAPVTETLGAFSFLAGHASSITAFSSP